MVDRVLRGIDAALDVIELTLKETLARYNGWGVSLVVTL